MRGTRLKDWEVDYAPVPSNYILLNPERGDGPTQVPEDVDFDLCLCQNKDAQYPLLKAMSKEFHIPLVCLEHCLPPTGITESGLQSYKSRRGDINVFISDFSREAWGWSKDEAEVIIHGVDTQLFSPAEKIVPKKNHCLSVVNDWINRSWCCGYDVWREVVQDDMPVFVLGKTPGLSEPAKDVHDLVYKYREADVFINTSTVSPIPSALLEAMSCGLAVVSTATAMIPKVIQHGVNGLMSNDPAELREFAFQLLRDKDLRARLGREARKTVVEQFSTEAFVAKWNDVFRRAANVIYKG